MNFNPYSTKTVSLHTCPASHNRISTIWIPISSLPLEHYFTVPERKRFILSKLSRHCRRKNNIVSYIMYSTGKPHHVFFQHLQTSNLKKGFMVVGVSLSWRLGSGKFHLTIGAWCQVHIHTGGPEDSTFQSQ